MRPHWNGTAVHDRVSWKAHAYGGHFRDRIDRRVADAGSWAAVAGSTSSCGHHCPAVARLARLPFPAGTAAAIPPLAVAGLLGAATGFFGGIMIGSNAENTFFPCGCDDPGLMGALLGAMIAPAITTPLAVHLANGRRGSFATELGWAAVVSGAGIVGILANVRDEAGALFLVLAPLVQVAVAVHNERATTN
jgi:hypothetical protein